MSAPRVLLSDPRPHLLLAELREKRAHLPLGLGSFAGALSPAAAEAEGPEDGRAGFDPLRALWLPGAVVELSALPGAGALTCGLLLLREARRRALLEGKSRHVCLVDPTRTLCAPAVAALGVPLEDLIVLQPDTDPQRFLRVAVRAHKSKAFSGVLVDASGLQDLSRLDVPVRRLALACEESGAVCALVTSSRARRGLALPVRARALIEALPSASGARELSVRFLKHRDGVPMGKHGLRISLAVA